MTIYIKNMVCIRCKMVVSAELIHLGLHYTRIDLGQADIIEDISAAQHEQIRADLLQSGFELIDDIKSILIERIKKVIIELVHHSEEALPINLSVHLSKELCKKLMFAITPVRTLFHSRRYTKDTDGNICKAFDLH